MSTVCSVPVEVKLALAFMMIDVFTGVLKAVKNKELNSTKAREGIYKKASFILFIAFGYLADYAMDYVNIGFNFPAAAGPHQAACAPQQQRLSRPVRAGGTHLPAGGAEIQSIPLAAHGISHITVPAVLPRKKDMQADAPAPEGIPAVFHAGMYLPGLPAPVVTT